MREFITLISIENIKLWKRQSTKTMFIIMIAIVIAATSGYKLHTLSQNTPNSGEISENWREDLQQNLSAYKAQLEEIQQSTDKTVKALIGVTQKNIAESEFRLNNNIPPESTKSIWTRVTDFSEKVNVLYEKTIGLFVIIACTIAVAGEFSEGTIKMMLPRPYKRHEIVTAKLIALMLYGLSLIITTLILTFVFLGVYFGFNGLAAKEMLWTTKSILYVPAVLKTLVIYGLYFLEILVYVLFAFALSAISRSRSIATGFSLFFLLIGASTIQVFSKDFSWLKYLPFALTNFESFVYIGSMIEGTTLLFALVISALYSVAFGLIGYLSFIYRDAL